MKIERKMMIQEDGDKLGAKIYRQMETHACKEKRIIIKLLKQEKNLNVANIINNKRTIRKMCEL